MSAPPQVPGFRTERLLGQGAFGHVYLAHETEGLARPVALKVFSSEGLDAFKRELEALKRIEEIRRRGRHSGIVQTLGSGEFDGRGWIALEYLEEGSLKDHVERQGPLSADEALGCVLEAAEAVGILHEAGVLHRDVKPANLLLGSDKRVRLGDFGLSRDLDASLSAAGSPAFSPPEVIAGKVAPEFRARVDVYGLGATLAYLLTGETSLPGRPDAFALERRGIPRPLVDLILAVMAYDPQERPADGGALVVLLQELRETLRTYSVDPEEACGEQRRDMLKTKHAAPTTEVTYDERDDVRVATNRCPFCHESVEKEGDAWVACRSCQARHHRGCWDEAENCSSCGSNERSVLEGLSQPVSRSSLTVGRTLAAAGLGLSLLGALAPAASSDPGQLLKHGGLFSLIACVLGVWLTARSVRELLKADARRALLATTGLAFLPLVAGLVGTAWGFAGAWEVVAHSPVSPDQEMMLDGGRQAWSSVKLGSFASLPVFFFCLLGLLFKRGPRT